MGVIQNSSSPDVYDLPEGSIPAAETELGALPPAFTENQLWAPNPQAMTLLPFSHDNQGWHMAVPNAVPGLVNSAYNALVGPAEIIHGKNPITGEAANPNPLGVANDIAGNLTGLGAATGEFNPLQLNTFGGLGAKNVDLVGRKAAIAAEKAGVPKEQIFQDTNWFRDKDSQWKFEIPDENITLHPSLEDKKGPIHLAYVIPSLPEQGIPLGQIYQNENLFKQYPHLADIKVISGGAPRTATYWDDYDGNGTKVIRLGNDTAENLKSTISHELQHGIQRYEGFGTGGSANQFLPADFEAKNKMLNQEFTDAFTKAHIEAGVAPEDLKDYSRAYIRNKSGTGSPDDRELVRVFNSDHPAAEHPAMDPLYDVMDRFSEHNKDYINAFSKYQSLSGEVEARNVQERLAQGISGDRTVFPWATPGYHPGNQTVLRGDRVPYQQDSFKGWHGTPHDFEPVEGNPFGEFRDDKIGSGEGAQVYGFGHYVAGRKGVAESYRDNLTQDLVFHNNDKIEPIGYDDQMRLNGTADPRKTAAELFTRGKDSLSFAQTEAQDLRQQAQGYLDFVNKQLKHADSSSKDFYLTNKQIDGKTPVERAQAEVDHYAQVEDFLDKEGPNLRKKSAGNLLHLEITPEEHQLLDWDEHLTKQPDEVFGKIGNIHPDIGTQLQDNKIIANKDSEHPALLRGSDLYHKLENKFGSSKAASRALSEAGIPGIKYADAGSRDPGTSRKTHNYVIFDPKHINIIGKNGQRLKMDPVDEDPFQ